MQSVFFASRSRVEAVVHPDKECRRFGPELLRESSLYKVDAHGIVDGSMQPLLSRLGFCMSIASTANEGSIAVASIAAFPLQSALQQARSLARDVFVVLISRMHTVTALLDLLHDLAESRASQRSCRLWTLRCGTYYVDGVPRK